MEENYIEVELDETVLKQLGYDISYDDEDYKWFGKPKGLCHIPYDRTISLSVYQKVPDERGGWQTGLCGQMA